MISLAVVATEPRAAAVAQEYRLLRDLRYSDARNCALVPDNHGALGLRLTPDCERAIDRRRDREARRRFPYPISVFERSHRSHRIAGDYPFQPRTVDPDQLLAKKGQVPFDALSLCRFSALRQRRLAGSDQLFDELAGRA